MTSMVPAARVLTLAGRELAEVSPVPETVGALKLAVEARLGIAQALQKHVAPGSGGILADDEVLDPAGAEVVMVLDETPLWAWDIDSNPAKNMLEVEGNMMMCPGLRTNYVNVLTKEPLRSGVHYFEFHLHHVGDEQWCGLVRNPAQAGAHTSGRSLEAWAYYSGRMGSRSTSLVDGRAALHAQHRAVAPFDSVRASGDIIGMLVDLVRGAVALHLNGKCQGACAIPTGTPLWVLTHLDTPGDQVELRKLPVQDAPEEAHMALGGALLDTRNGKLLNFWDVDDDDEGEFSDYENPYDSCGEDDE